MADYFAATTALLADTSLRALLLAVLAAIVLRFWPARNANFQHRAWTAVLWCMLLLPALAQFTPTFSLLPVGWRLASRPIVRQSSAEVRQTSPTEPRINISAPPAEVASDVSESDIKASKRLATGLPTVATAADIRERVAAATAQTAAFGWPCLILVLYLFGVALLVTRLALSYLAVRRLVGRATDIPPPPDCRARVATSDAVRVPVSVGLLKPVILLPADWSRWSEALLASVVAHEQAHIDRRDHLVLLVSELNRCLYWFHPVAWFLRRRLSALAEQCCDDTVIAALRSRGDYAQHLLEIASRLTASPRRVAPLGVSMARDSQVESRIVAILDERRPLAGRIGRGGALTLAAIVGPIVLLAAGLRAADPPSQAQPAVAAKETVVPATEQQTVAAPAQPAIQPEAAKPPVKGMPLSGRVVLASDGSPAVGAEIQLLLTKPDWHRLDARRTKTDEQGDFAFEDVPAGSHWLVAVMDGLASRHERSKMTWITITADHPPEPVLLKLSPAPSIAVHVTSKADGTPVAGAQVWLDNQWDEQTDAQGRVVLKGLTPEVWRVRIRAEGFAQQTIPLKLAGNQRAELNFALEPEGKIHGTVKDPSGKPLANVEVNVSRYDGPWLTDTQTDAAGRYHFDFLPLVDKLQLNAGGEPYTRVFQNVVVSAGGGSDLEVNLVVERQPAGGSVQGVVTDMAGKPIVGASLTNGGNSARAVHETFTVGAGRFTIDDVYTSGKDTFMVVRAKGFAPQAVSLNPGPADEPTEIAVKLQPGHRIRGRVLEVVGKPIAGVMVYYAHGPAFSRDDIGGHAKTDAEGRFEFDSLPSDCAFDFLAKGYSPLHDQMFALDGEQEVTVTLQPQGVVRGRVVNAATGVPITAFRLRIAHSPDRQPDDPKGGISGKIWEGVQFEPADGQFVLDDLMVNLPLQVSVYADDFGVTTLRRVLPRPAADAEIVEFKLGPSDPAMIGTLSGVFVDEEGRPKPGAQLRLIVTESDPEPQRRFRFQWGWVRDGRVATHDGVVQFLSTTTDRQGAFRFDHVRTDKEIELWCWGEGISDDRVVHLEAFTDGQRQHLHIENPTPGAIEGKINRDTYPDVSNVSAIHQGEGGGYDVDFQNLPQKTDYQLRNLPPGRYLINVERPLAPGERFRPLRDGQFIIVEPGKTTKLDLGF